VGWAGSDGFSDDLATLSFTPDIYSPNARLVDEELVAAAHDRGVQLIPWTVNDPSTMKRLIRLGVDGLITDYPDRGQAVLRERTDDS
jgi:glycerophosphoryl diester phosphodiesterase